MMKGLIKVTIVDPEPIARLGLKMLLQQGGAFRVHEESDSASNESWVFSKVRPDLAIIDLAMDGGNGLQLLARISKLRRRIACVAWIRQSETSIVCEAIRAGALAVLLRTDALEELHKALLSAHRGKRYLSASVAALLCDQFVDESSLPALSHRQAQIYRQIGAGFSAADIAGQLGISAKTVHTHIERMKLALQCDSINSLRRSAIACRFRESRLPTI